MNFIVGVFGFLLSTQLGKHFFLPFSYLSGIRIDYLAPTLYAIDLVSFVLIASLFVQKTIQMEKLRIVIKKYWLSMCIAFFCLLLNLYFAPSKELWLYAVVRILQWIGVLTFFILRGSDAGLVKSLIWGVFFGAVLTLVLALMQLSTRRSVEGIFYWLGERRLSIATPSIAKAVVFGKEFLRPYGTFSHPNSMGGFYLLLYVFVLTQRERIEKGVRIILLFVTSALVIISFSRTALVVYAVIHLIYFFRTAPRCKICVIAKYAFVSFILVIALLVSGDRQSLQKRTDLAYKAVSILLQNPGSGSSLGGYLIAQHAYPQQFPVFFEQPVHSIYLYALAQLGIPLSFLVLSYIWLFVRPFMRFLPFTLPLAVVLLTGAVDHYWLTLPQNLFQSATIFGILIASHEKQISGNR